MRRQKEGVYDQSQITHSFCKVIHGNEVLITSVQSTVNIVTIRPGDKQKACKSTKIHFQPIFRWRLLFARSDFSLFGVICEAEREM